MLFHIYSIFVKKKLSPREEDKVVQFTVQKSSGDGCFDDDLGLSGQLCAVNCELIGERIVAVG